MKYDKADEVFEERFEWLLSRYQIDLVTTMKGSIFFFDCVNLLHCKCHKVNLNHGRSYINSPYSIKQEIKNPFNTLYYKCFQYAATLALNHGKNWKKSEKISKIKHFIDKYNWETINIMSEKDDWKKLEKQSDDCSKCFMYW